MKNAYLRSTIISVTVHIACMYVLIAFSLASCHSRRLPKDQIFFVDFQPGPPPPPATVRGMEPEPEKAEPAPPEPVDVPEPIPEPPRTKLPKPAAIETVKKPKIEVSTNIVKRAAVPGARRPVKKLSAAQIRNMLGTAVANVVTPSSAGQPGSAGVPSAEYGAGTASGSGEATPYGWYLAEVRAIMYDAWQQPSALAGKRGLVTRVLVRIRQDGQIVQKKMVDASGNSLMDTSVMLAVESVKTLPELPFGFGGAYKDITIDFELEDTGP